MSAPAEPTAVAVPAADTVPTPTTETTAPVTSTTVDDSSVAPAVPAKDDVPATTEAAAPAVVASEAAPAAAAAAETETKPVEPVTEGHLGYKAPGLLKQFTFAKKDFFFVDEPVSPKQLNLFLRGEKAEISHPVVAWASQTGKGLLFFNKKNESDKTHPAGVIALYDATDLRKTSPHEFTFRLHNQSHTFKASSDAERDGWYVSIEKAIEIGKAQKETIQESEGYKAELAKLGTPSATVAAAPALAAGTTGTAAAAAAADKPVEADEDARRVNSSEGEELKKKNHKSRSTSRGFVNRLMGKKDELENKAEHKKEEKKAEKEEKKIEKEEQKAAEHSAVEPAPVAVAAAAAPTETKAEEPVESAAVAEEKPKASKRGSIFGSLKSSFKSPTKEKEQKDAELKTDATKDTVVSDVPPQLPETTTTTTSPAEITAVPAVTTEPTTATPAAAPATETKTAEEKEIISTPNREKKNFLSGLSFINKRDRSVSPSNPVAAKETTAETDAKPLETSTATATETPVAAATTTATTDAKADEKAEETTPVANKRQSVLGGLGRRASKIIQRVQPSKKENASPTAAAATTGTAATETKTDAPVEETAVTEINPIAAETTAAPAPVTAVDETATETKPAPVSTSVPPAVTASA